MKLSLLSYYDYYSISSAYCPLSLSRLTSALEYSMKSEWKEFLLFYGAIQLGPD